MGGKSNATKGRSRKENDRVDLAPVSRSGSGGGGTTGGGTGASVCPLSFEIALPESIKLPDGTQLFIRRRDSHWFIVTAGQNVMSIRKDKAVMLARCLEQGYRYAGKITTRVKKRYGEFQRSG